MKNDDPTHFPSYEATFCLDKPDFFFCIDARFYQTSYKIFDREQQIQISYDPVPYFIETVVKTKNSHEQMKLGINSPFRSVNFRVLCETYKTNEKYEYSTSMPYGEYDFFCLNYPSHLCVNFQ